MQTKILRVSTSMERYLADNKQFVQINDTKSDLSAFTKRVPQGSLLGPLQFINCINDLAEASNLFDCNIWKHCHRESIELQFSLRNHK